MLHVRAQPRAFENDMSAHRRNMQSLRGRVTSVCLRSWAVLAEETPPPEHLY
jgi:hypothetical protein